MKELADPPKWATRLLGWYCQPELIEDLEGALYELYVDRAEKIGPRKAGYHYWLDVITHCRPHTWKKTKTQNSTSMIGNHIKFSLRNIRKSALNSTLNAIGLSTGLASFMLIMLWINLETSFDRFHERQDRIYRISNTFKSKAETFSQAPSGPALGARLQTIFPEVENGTRFFRTSMQLEVNNEIFLQRGVGVVDPSFLDIFTFPVLNADKGAVLLTPMTILLSERLAAKYFGSEEPIGKTLELDGGFSLQVSGILKEVPENSQLQFDALVSLETMKKVWGSEDFDNSWGGGWFQTYLLLRPGADVDQLEEDITSFIGEKLSDWAEMGMYYEYFLQPLSTIHLESDLRYDFASNGSIQSIKIFSIAAMVVLLLACINYVNMATANAMKRAREVGIRKVMGSSRRSILMQMIVETSLVTVISMMVAIGLVYLLLPLVRELTGYQNIILWSSYTITFLGALLLIIMLVSGVFPALLVSGFPLLHVIRAGVRQGTSLAFLRRSLVVFQFTATGVLLISMIVIHDQMQFIQNRPLGMETQNVLHINFRGMPDVTQNAKVLRNELLSVPSIEHVSYLDNSYPVNGLSNSGADVETGDGSFVRSSIYTLRVDPNFAETFGLDLVAGRFFSEEFPTDSTQSVIVNEACIQNFSWGSAEAAIGKRFGREPNQRKVIGVVRNFHFEALHKSIEPVRILPARPSRYGTVALKFEGDDPVRVISEVQSTWERIIPSVPLDLSMMNDDIRRQYTAEYNFRTIFMVFGLLSIIIGSLGLFGLVTAAVHQRLKELSIRKVLGASVIQILALINRHFVILVVVAMVIASPIAYWLMQNWLENFSYHIQFSVKYVLYALTGTVLITVLIISANALKTATTNPADVLKDE